VIVIETTFAGKTLQLWREPWQRRLNFVGGTVSRSTPVFIYWTKRSKGRAEKEARKLKSYGYVSVSVQKGKEVRDGPLRILPARVRRHAHG